MHKSNITPYHNFVVFPFMIGKKVWKNPRTTSRTLPKPFKSGLKVNTVSGIIQHPNQPFLAFTFEEDDSYVACHKCSIAPEKQNETM